MYLKSLELHGFKSFPDKTVLHFNPGTTIIVGPNGSGKSNITDAMRWVLGELSSKNLRGSKMEDVIFSGADGVRPMGFAEVSITFDNSGEVKTINSEYDEITVTRRYYRAGDSAYFINKKPVRLKDIYELFMNTGIGREGYSIIGQGKIAEIISKKSEERRSIFEESAGITKYRYRKQESQKKLSETEANMTRVADIQSEIESRIGPLEREAGKARQYLELYDEKKKLDISLWLYDINRLRDTHDKTEADTKMSAHELEMADDTMKALEAKIERMYELSHNNKEEAQRNLEKINQTRSAHSKLENDAKILENNVFHAKKLLDDEQRLLAEAENALFKERENYNNFKEKSIEIKKAAEDSEKESDRILSERNSLVEERNKKDAVIEELFEKRQAHEADLNEMRVRLNVLKNTVSSQAEQKSDLRAQIDEYKNQIDVLESDYKAISDTVSAYEDQILGLKKSFSENDSNLLSISEEIENLNKDRASLAAASESLKSRITALERMLEHFDGYNNSVRFIMSEFKAGRISGIHGPLSNLISVKKEYAIAIETAMGAALQNIVTSDEKAAKEAIYSLKRSGAGRATFYPITTVKASKRTSELESASSCKGFVGFADDLAECAPEYREIVSSVIGRVAVFDNIDNASNMARARGWKVRAVTLDGQQINAGGSFTGGSSRRDSGMLTRTSQIDSMKKELADVSVQIEKNSEDMRKADEKRSEYANLKLETEEKIRLLESLLNVEKAQLGEIEAKKNVASGLIDKLNADIENYDGNREKSKADMVRIEADILSVEKAISEINRERSELAGERGELDLKSDEMTAALSDARITTAQLEKDIENTEALMLDCVGRISDREDEIGRRKEEIKRLNAEIAGAAEKSNDILRESDAKNTEAAELENKQKQIEEESDRIESELSSLRRSEKEQSAKKEILFVAHTKNENKLSQINSDIDKMTSRLWDEYELTYSSAAEFGKEAGFEEVTEANRRQINSKFGELKSQIKALGHVNVAAIEDYAQTKERYDYIKCQMDDLTSSKKELEDIINGIENDMRAMFTDAFDKINRNFSEVFKELFGGGNAELTLTNPDDVLTSGIEISAAPPGKTIKNLNLLSGGEQAFIAIALMFALIKFNPSPFCIFDEIEAALDEVNVTRVANYVRKYSEHMQIIMITHRRGTMEIADTLYGVTMPRHGISKVFTLDINNNAENDKFVKG